MSPHSGRVLAFYGQQCLVECRGEVYTINARRVKPTPVCNDDVELAPTGDAATWIVTKVLKRRSELKRVTARGKTEVVCANVDQIIAVIAATPQPDWVLMDRYAAAAEFEGLSFVLVHNKSDLPLAAADLAALDDFKRLGVDVITTHHRADDSLQNLQRCLMAKVSVLVGQSGVGKSTLTNALVPDAAQRTQALSDSSQEGKHTTTVSIRYHVPSGGELIDSPGVRDFAPPLPTQAQLQFGFKEIAEYRGQCHFNNCQHLEEPRCAVKAALQAGHISARRYHSYVDLLRLAKRLGA